jgi:hypothetical protein
MQLLQIIIRSLAFNSGRELQATRITFTFSRDQGATVILVELVVNRIYLLGMVANVKGLSSMKYSMLWVAGMNKAEETGICL